MGETKIDTKLFCAQSSLTKPAFKSTIWTSLGMRVFPSALSAALCLGVFFSGGTTDSWAAGGNDKAAMSAMEQRLFFKSYDSDQEDVRVGRLEKQVFGEGGSGDIHERLQKLMDATGTQQNPDGSVSGLNTPPPPTTPPTTPQSKQQQQSDEREAAMQRAQVALQAQKEQQINDLLQQGVQLWRAKRGREAIDKFTQVLQMDPGNAEANFSMGIAFESSNNLPEALASYQRASQGKPDNKDYSDAIAAVQRKLQSKVGIDDKQGQLKQLAEDASAAYHRGEFISALQMYKELDQKAPNQALVKYNIGTLYLSTQNPIAALPYFKEALRLKPSEPRYQTAVQQLETNLHNAEQQRLKQEQEYAAVDQQPQGVPQNYQRGGGYQQAPQQKMSKLEKPPKEKKEKPPKQAPNVLPTPAAADAMAGMGIVAKSGRDGVQIIEVGIASRASKVGLLKGDVIKAVNGTIVTHTKQINEILGNTQPGAPVQMTIQRAAHMGQVSL